MRATEFERHHPRFLHLPIIGAAAATYLVDPEDIVWRLIAGSPSRILLEHVVFSFATILIGAGAVLCTRTRPDTTQPFRQAAGPYLLGEWLYAMGLATLLPLLGCLLLITAESLRIARLALSDQNLPAIARPQRDSSDRYTTAFHYEFVKWGIFVSMIAFSICLIDRVADIGITTSIAIWSLLNIRRLHRLR